MWTKENRIRYNRQQTEAAHREDLVQSLEDALRDGGGVVLKARARLQISFSPPSPCYRVPRLGARAPIDSARSGRCRRRQCSRVLLYPAGEACVGSRHCGN